MGGRQIPHRYGPCWCLAVGYGNRHQRCPVGPWLGKDFVGFYMLEYSFVVVDWLCSDNSAERPESERSDSAPSQVGKKWRRADTNVVAIKFDQLKKPSNMHTGDPVSCVKCHAMMSHISSVREDADDQVSQMVNKIVRLCSRPSTACG